MTKSAVVSIHRRSLLYMKVQRVHISSTRTTARMIEIDIGT